MQEFIQPVRDIDDDDTRTLQLFDYFEQRLSLGV
jgi:hypothetical protein